MQTLKLLQKNITAFGHNVCVSHSQTPQVKDASAAVKLLGQVNFSNFKEGPYLALNNLVIKTFYITTSNV